MRPPVGKRGLDGVGIQVLTIWYGRQKMALEDVGVVDLVRQLAAARAGYSIGQLAGS